MLLNCTTLSGPNNLPIYFERLPGSRTVTIAVAVFVGSADDLQVGAPGVYHWFEHVPFRGTKHFPNGDKDFEIALGRHATYANAGTDKTTTTFGVSAAHAHWKDGILYCLDLVACPLLRTDDILAERDVIMNEIRTRFGEPDIRLEQRADELIFDPQHPLTHSVIGTEESLRSMDPDTVRRAHAQAYSWNRTVVFVSGDVEAKEVVDVVGEYVVRHPLPDLSERRYSISHGYCPFTHCGQHTEASRMVATRAQLHVPILPPFQKIELEAPWTMALNMLTVGGLHSPLLQLLRHKEKLVYGIRTELDTGSDKWCVSIGGDTQPGLGANVLAGIENVLCSPHGDDRLAWVHDYLVGQSAHEAIGSLESVHHAIGTYEAYGEPLTRHEERARLLAVSYEEIVACLQHLANNLPQSIKLIFEGED